MKLDNIRIVLVHTSHPGNIGGVARAMKNMGIGKLYLVAPRQYPDEQANWRAASAGDVLDRAVVTQTLEEAIADCQFVVGTSARGRRIPWPLLDPRECAQRMGVASGHGEVAVIFGREDRGLTNDELKLCNLHLNIPTDDAYSSLNLAMAVQIVCYELRMLMVSSELPADEHQQWDTPFSSSENMERFYVHLEETLVDIEFLDPAAPRQLMSRLRRLYSRVRLDEMELNILRGILTQTRKWVAKARKP
ncbi:MAG: tRNA (cytosine(32)/uridine(32)-2'-O)-methyltransferase TrmJ [Proteobacteria bacterium]|nr:tRNA (cytosine(32)/uridine(32)-2'-O)-methyltransferase TrmJ [Pseudomonadota bacterium]